MNPEPTPNPAAPEISTSPAAAPVTNQAAKAPGVIPKHLQSWIALAVIALIAVAVWFSGSGPKTNAKTATAASQAQPANVAGLTPDELQKRLDETEAASRLDANRPGQVSPADPRPNADAAFLAANQPPAQPPARDPIEDEERKREYAGRFASNVALSYRADPRAGSSGTHSPTSVLAAVSNPEDVSSAATLPAGLPANFQQQLDTLQATQQQLLAQQQQFAAAAATAGPQAQPAQAAPAPSPTRKNAALNAAAGKEHVIFEGTVLESVLVNRLNGDFAGPVICQTTNDLYSHDHSELLIPAGARVLGETRKVADTGQERLAVVFHRLIMPDGFALDLDQAPGLNQVGETALHDQVNNHYFKIFGSSIAVGAIAGLATIGANNSAVTGLPTSNLSAYREGVTGSLSQSSLQILNKFLNIPPTIAIREGHRVRIFLTQDLLAPAYAAHTIPSNL